VIVRFVDISGIVDRQFKLFFFSQLFVVTSD